jgi:isoprenylcysteine carboxyl methyltransferase (ICMT) family protein YpbQ
MKNYLINVVIWFVALSLIVGAFNYFATGSPFSNGLITVRVTIAAIFAFLRPIVGRRKTSE